MHNSGYLTRRTAITHALAGLTAGSLPSVSAWAADPYPSKVITALHGYPAGGGGDFAARLVSNRMAKNLGQNIVIENLGGAGGSLAPPKLFAAPADGHTILMGTLGELVLAPLSLASAKYKSEDFRLVGQYVDSYLLLLARPDLPANNIQEFVALAKSRSDRPLSCGHLGRGSAWHLAAERFMRDADVKLLNVPYRGGAQLIPDLISGQVDVSFLALGGPTVGLIQKSQLKALGFAAPSRQTVLPSVPTFDETGIVKNFVFSYWSGVMVRPETPEPVVQRLHASLTEAVNDNQVRKALEDGGLLAVSPTTLAEASRFFTSEMARYRSIARSISLQPE